MYDLWSELEEAIQLVVYSFKCTLRFSRNVDAHLHISFLSTTSSEGRILRLEDIGSIRMLLYGKHVADQFPAVFPNNCARILALNAESFLLYPLLLVLDFVFSNICFLYRQQSQKLFLVAISFRRPYIGANMNFLQLIVRMEIPN